MTQPIHFYEATDNHGCFSNFALYPINLDGKTWPTTEHYFQAQKFIDPGVQSRVRKARTPGEAARLGRDRTLTLRPHWKAIRIIVMKKALEAKFQQHPELALILLDTGNAKLVEHTSRDDFWGDGGDGSGKNLLGRMLMEVRSGLRSQ